MKIAAKNDSHDQQPMPLSCENLKIEAIACPPFYDRSSVLAPSVELLQVGVSGLGKRV